ncbi:hypothetical protein [Borreliella tanukii]|nr:hypothetical protein [Borreliella tanukii]WKC79357.1 hypothetical protein QIA28_00150 [Borreliella tanukii]
MFEVLKKNELNEKIDSVNTKIDNVKKRLKESLNASKKINTF